MANPEIVIADLFDMSKVISGGVPVAQYARGPQGTGLQGSYLRSALTATGLVNTATNADQTLLTIALPALQGINVLNYVNKLFKLRVDGQVATDPTAGNWTVKVKLGAITLVSMPAQALIGSLAPANWRLDFNCATVTTGATATLESHATLIYHNSNTAGAASTVAIDTNSGVSAAIDLTAAQNLTVTVAFSAPGGGSTNNIAAWRLISVLVDG